MSGLVSNFDFSVLGSKWYFKQKNTYNKSFYSKNVDILRHENFENWLTDGGEMAVFCKTLNLSQICQTNVLPKCDENCQKSISKQNLMNITYNEGHFLFNKKIYLWSKKNDFIK